MTPDQIALVRQSFAAVLPIKDAAAALFGFGASMDASRNARGFV